MRTSPATALLLALPLSGCAFLEEQRTAPDTVRWSGTVYGDVPAEGTALLEAGTLEAVDLDDMPISEGAMYEDSPGSWVIEVPADTELALRVGGGAQVPTVWRARSPQGRGYWFDGALFAVGAETLDTLLDSLRGFEGLDPADLADEEVAHLWGAPLDRDAFAGVDVTVEHADGSTAAVTLAYDEDGALIDAGTGPVDMILAVDLAPGPVTLVLTADDGAAAETTWPARGGDLLAAFYLVAP